MVICRARRNKKGLVEVLKIKIIKNK